MQFGTTASDALSEAHDRIAMNAGDALGGADAQAFGEAGNDFDLLSRERLFTKLILRVEGRAFEARL